jgi:hypothetical protein
VIQNTVHYGLHFGLPLLIALVFYKQNWLKAYAIMLLAFIIDLDHLLANPIFDANRCSINFHSLHSYYAIAVYLVLLLPKYTRLFALGLISHIISDFADCWLM